MALKTIPKITNKQISEKGVQALADRPNLSAQYGASGLSAAQLKLWFDQFATFLAQKINEISDAMSGGNAAEYIRIQLDSYGIDNLGALVESFNNGSFADSLLKLYKNAGEGDKSTLQEIINEQAQNLSTLVESVKNLSESKLDNSHDTAPTSHATAMALKVDRADIMEVFEGEDVNNKAKAPSAYALSGVITAFNNTLFAANEKIAGAIIDATYNPTTGVIVFTKQNGETITYDLPSEKILKADASYYDDETRTLHLVLMDENEIVINVADLVDEYYADNETIELYIENGQKKFRIKPSFKFILDDYGRGLTEHGGKIDKKVNVADIIDNVVSEADDKPLSAKQGKVLKSAIDTTNTTLLGTFKAVSYNNATGIFTLTKVDGSTQEINFPLESFVSDASFNPTTNKVTLIVSNGKSVEFDLSALIDYYYGDDTTTEVYVDSTDGKKKIRVKSDFLNEVNQAIAGLDERLEVVESAVQDFRHLENFGSIGKADGETITMEEDTGNLSARKLKLANGTVLEIVSCAKDKYDTLTEKSENTLYLIEENGTLSIALGNKLLYGGVRDSENGNPISFRQLTRAVYDGLTEKDYFKVYLIEETDGTLSVALGDRITDHERRTTYLSSFGGILTNNASHDLTAKERTAISISPPVDFSADFACELSFKTGETITLTTSNIIYKGRDCLADGTFDIQPNTSYYINFFAYGGQVVGFVAAI